MNGRVGHAAIWIASLSIIAWTSPARADVGKTFDRADVRWAADGPGGTPEFTRHIVPLLGKMGCNGRACHGSFQGQNGFRLSLFGHDPAMDYRELTDDEGEGPRVVPGKPGKTLALRKPLDLDGDHGGGERFERGSWPHRLLREWVASGAVYDADKEAALERIEVQPNEILLDRESEQDVPLAVVAYFSDGTKEDVTPLTLFWTNDEAVANVDDDGRVTSAGSGGTAIVVTYGGAVITAQVIVPFDPGDVPKADFVEYNPIDHFVSARLDKLRIVPSELSTDEEFLRRAFLDVIGTLPTSDEARRFLADRHADKRDRLVDDLLNRPEYAMYWATRFSDWTGNDNRFTPQPRAKTGWLWYDWLRDKLERNVPYDEIVGGFITATTREGRPLDEVIDEYTRIRDNLEDGFDDGTYASRATNDIYWLKAGNTNSETIALQAAYAFLGVRLECASCHKHPFDRWTQDDFRGFTSFFAAASTGTPDDVPEELTEKRGQNDYRYREVYFSLSGRSARELEEHPPKPLGAPVVEVREDHDPRVDLWEWMRSPDTPYLSQAIANRLWGHYFGVGIVQPVDDFNAANPPSNPELLEWLARDFVESGFDLKHLHRTILTSRTYQLSWRPNASNALDERNFSHALLRRMQAEVVLDAINQVTGGTDRYNDSNAPPGTRAIGLAPSRLRGDGPEYALGIFGRPLRTQTCDCERSCETGLAQALYLLNDVEVNGKIADRDGRLKHLLDEIPDDRAMVEELYLSTLSRYPTDDEMGGALAFVAQASSREVGMQDVLWSLLNLREFIFVH